MTGQLAATDRIRELLGIMERLRAYYLERVPSGIPGTSPRGLGQPSEP